jgi:hypothetical protein
VFSLPLHLLSRLGNSTVLLSRDSNGAVYNYPSYNKYPDIAAARPSNALTIPTAGNNFDREMK